MQRRGRRGNAPSYDRSYDRGNDRRSGGNNEKTVYIPTKDGGLRKTTVRYMEEARGRRDDREYDRDYGYGDYDGYRGYNGYDYPCVRMTIGDLGYERDYVDVQITPTNNANYRTKVRWTPILAVPRGTHDKIDRDGRTPENNEQNHESPRSTGLNLERWRTAVQRTGVRRIRTGLGRHTKENHAIPPTGQRNG